MALNGILVFDFRMMVVDEAMVLFCEMVFSSRTGRTTKNHRPTLSEHNNIAPEH